MGVSEATLLLLWLLCKYSFVLALSNAAFAFQHGSAFYFFQFL